MVLSSDRQENMSREIKFNSELGLCKITGLKINFNEDLWHSFIFYETIAKTKSNLKKMFTR